MSASRRRLQAQHGGIFTDLSCLPLGQTFKRAEIVQKTLVATNAKTKSQVVTPILPTTIGEAQEGITDLLAVTIMEAMD